MYYAFDDTCTHRGCLLSQGELEGTRVICPCHAGLFDVATGEVLAGPPPEPVETFAVRLLGEDVEIEL
jgi:nitrite reductase/ring-hydroxylating ferredoxin subunit